ncbi:hypothetical protein CW304_06910 [Bacillus sp. UFRGS-B20]|nr:hypothetical protein CW304_06910 [Bacillus sp. UFRGS-B20]
MKGFNVQQATVSRDIKERT